MYSNVRTWSGIRMAPGSSSLGTLMVPQLSRSSRLQSWPMRLSSPLVFPHLLWVLFAPQGSHMESSRYAQWCPGGLVNNSEEFSKQVLLPVEKWCITGYTFSQGHVLKPSVFQMSVTDNNFASLKVTEVNGGGPTALSFGSYYGPSQTHGKFILFRTAASVAWLID